MRFPLTHKHDRQIDLRTEQLSTTILADISLYLYRVEQEVLNVIKHSDTDSGRIVFRETNGRWIHDS
jgi:signal transduction histidine kinase